MFIDTHTHLTPWSHDAGQTLTELTDQLGKNNLAGACITDHYEKDLFYAPFGEDVFDLDAYFASNGPVRQEPDSMHPGLLVGVEAGWLPHLHNHLTEVIRHYPFDSVILSMHLLHGQDPFVDKTVYAAGPSVLYPDLIDSMAAMVESFQDFDILGHFDYFSRYAPWPQPKLLYRHSPAAFDRLFRILISQDQCLEINTRTILKLEKIGCSKTDRFPDAAIISRYLELGGKYLSLGSDAHQAGEVGQLFPETTCWLKKQGVTALTYYSRRKPCLIPIQDFKCL